MSGSALAWLGIIIMIYIFCMINSGYFEYERNNNKSKIKSTAEV
jgi:predicted permease